MTDLLTKPLIDHWSPADHGFPVDRLDEFLLWAADAAASDISFQTGTAARVEIDGILCPATAIPLDSTAIGAIARRINGDTTETLLRSGKPVDCSHAVLTQRRRARRFRVNMSPVLVTGATGVNISIRVLPDDPPSFSSLGIEQEIQEAWSYCRGLTIVTGVPGSGKSTLLAAARSACSRTTQAASIPTRRRSSSCSTMSTARAP